MVEFLNFNFESSLLPPPPNPVSGGQVLSKKNSCYGAFTCCDLGNGLKLLLGSPADTHQFFRAMEDAASLLSRHGKI
jgi:hypothetical protein